MKVKELVELLSGFDQNSEIIIQKDGEGNEYSPLSGVDNQAVYVPDSTWSGEVYSTLWTAEDADMEEKEWKKLMKKKRCVVLFPVN
jgi:hypothetical protein